MGNLKLSQLDGIFHDFLTLKKLRRTGWQLRGIKEGESIADHCFGVVFLTFLLAPLIDTHEIDRNHALALAICHELGECRIGDIPFTALKYFPGKSAAEQTAISDMTAPLGAGRDEYEKFSSEFESCATLEARFVRAIDKLEMLITAYEYEKNGFSGLGDFWENADTFACFAEFPQISEYAEHLRNSRTGL